MVNIKITDDCIHCGACAAVCPENFEMTNGKAKVKNPNPDKVGCAKEAADGCPVSAIKITE